MGAAAKAFAPAKINLYLHVGAPTGDGYHPVSSLMGFADVGDSLRLEPADAFGFALDGPMAEGLPDGPENLVLRAAQALFDQAGIEPPPVKLTLYKRLPTAAGLGGGSSDAGAALRALRTGLGLELDDAALEAIAAGLGADGAACFRAKAVQAQGRGERLSSPPTLPPLDAVLVNPGVPSPTGPVYRAYDAAGAPGDAETPPPPGPLADAEAVAAWLAQTRNDLEAPAVALNPRIGSALAIIRREPEALFTRMSGSGSTCFALTRSRRTASALAARLGAAHPHWWVRPCHLS